MPPLKSAARAAFFGLVVARSFTSADGVAAQVQAGSPRAPATALRPPPNAVPKFVVDTSWPLALPPAWTWRQRDLPQSDVLGINVDGRDHVWITHRSVIAEYDPAGNLLRMLQRPAQPGHQYTTIHGMYMDHNGFLWTTAREQHLVLKLTAEGRVALAIGRYNETGGSADTARLGRPAEVYVDQETNEVYVADGYTNKRVIVFDGATGKYLRHWGAYGKQPNDTARDRPVAGQLAAVSQLNVPHGITGSRDGLIYVADRTNSRIQVFRRNGEYVTEGFTRPGTGGAFSVALSPDPDQEFVYVCDGTQHRIWILRRRDMQVVGQFSGQGGGPGEVGRPHNITVDSRGNIYVAEADPGRRAQRFLFAGWEER